MNRLYQLPNDSLISDLKDLVAQEREMLLEILRYLKEVENRQLYLKMGYPSLFAFLTEALAYSEGAAQRRIQAMRLMKALPEVEPKIESGEISLSVASQVQGFIQREDKKRKTDKLPLLKPTEKLQLLSQLEGSSSRECDRQLVKIAPETGISLEKTKPLSATQTLIQFVADSELMEKLEKLKSLTSHSNPDRKYEILFNKLAEIALDKLDPERRAKRREQRKQRAKMRQVSSTTKPSSENLPKADHLKAPKKSPNNIKSPRAGAPCEAQALGGSPYGKENDQPLSSSPPTSAVSINNKDVSKPITSPIKNNEKLPYLSPPTSAVARSRYIPNRLRDHIYQRDQGKCQFRNPKTQIICKSTHQLELDHQFPYSLGGEHSENNLQWLCRRHNRYRTEMLR